LSSINLTENTSRRNGNMSAELTGTQAQTRNDNKSQVNGNHVALSASQAPQQHLTPDRPPQPFEGGETKQKRPRGFAAMDRTIVSEIARKGGKAAHSAGTAHEFTSEEARVAGRKGGRATHAKRRQGGDESTGEVESSPSVDHDGHEGQPSDESHEGHERESGQSG
jgi:general stress protein YciG